MYYLANLSPKPYISKLHPLISRLHPSLQDVRLYEEVTSLEELTGVVEGALEEYNNMHKNRMNLVIFRSDRPPAPGQNVC